MPIGIRLQNLRESPAVTTISILSIGFLLGMKHATEADHVAAVATLAAGRNSFAQTLKQGMAWGIGHTATLMLFGGFVLALGKSVPPQLADALELAVGLMLIALGADVLRRVRRGRIHFHAHDHPEGVRHAHVHSHAGDSHRHAHRHAPPLRAAAVGMMHGMAGSAALILLSLQAVQSRQMGLVYIAVFGLGSIAAMALFSAVMAISLRWTSSRCAPLHDALAAGIGAITCALGALTVYRIGVAEGVLGGSAACAAIRGQALWASRNGPAAAAAAVASRFAISHAANSSAGNGLLYR